VLDDDDDDDDLIPNSFVKIMAKLAPPRNRRFNGHRCEINYRGRGLRNVDIFASGVAAGK